MDIGYIVGIIVAVFTIICGCIAAIYAKRNDKDVKWAVLAIIIGIIALISAPINYYLFN